MRNTTKDFLIFLIMGVVGIGMLLSLITFQTDLLESSNDYIKENGHLLEGSITDKYTVTMFSKPFNYVFVIQKDKEKRKVSVSQIAYETYDIGDYVKTIDMVKEK